MYLICVSSSIISPICCLLTQTSSGTFERIGMHNDDNDNDVLFVKALSEAKVENSLRNHPTYEFSVLNDKRKRNDLFTFVTVSRVLLWFQYNDL